MLSACGASPTAQPSVNPYAAEYQQGLADAKSGFVRQVLSDGVITHDEYLEAYARLSQCLADAGIKATQSTDQFGLISISVEGKGVDGAESQQVWNSCSDQWLGPIGQIYREQFQNPNNQDLESLIASCLVKRGLVTPGFTGADLVELEYKYGYRVDGTPPTPITPQPFILPGGVNASTDPIAAACWAAPIQASTGG